MAKQGILMAVTAPYEVVADPTELSTFAIKGRMEYEPREFCSVWVAREMTREDADYIAGCLTKRDAD